LQEDEDAPRDIPFQLNFDGRQPQFKNTNPKFQFKIWSMTVQTDMSLNNIHVTQNHLADHCSVNYLDGVNKKELIEKKLRKVGPN